MIKLILVAIVPLSSLAAGTGTEPTAFEYLKQMQHAAKSVNYEGVFVYAHDGQLESMKILHKADKQGDYERITHLNGSPREVVRENDVVTCILSDKKSVVIDKRQSGNQLLNLLPEDLNKFARYYDVQVGATGRIADREGVLITVTPRDKLRYGYNLWIDKATYLLLKSELVNEAGQVVEQIMFTDISLVDDIPVAKIRSNLTATQRIQHSDYLRKETVGAVMQNWKIAKMPLGFELTEHKKQHGFQDGVDVQHLILSDGLASMSVYIEKLVVSDDKFLGSTYMGAVNVFGAVVDDYQVTVVGEVPRATVQMVAESVIFDE